MSLNNSPSAVLFDLDGTLIDTAPDMAAALNNILQQEGLQALSLQTIRPHISRGGLALTRLAFEQHRDEVDIEPLRQRFLDEYLNHIAVYSRLFDGFNQVLDTLENNRIPWGIVTNKPAWLTEPLVAGLDLAQRSCVTISGDSTAERKPHPLPLTTAAERIGTECENCIYVGDDPRDIQAGNAANMTTVIARYGYITDPGELDGWQADAMIDTPQQILELLELS